MQQQYELMIINMFRYLNVKTLAEAESMTLYEYQIRMLAYKLKQADEQERMLTQSWMNQVVKSTNGRGKPKYRKAKQIYNHEKVVNQILGLSNTTVETNLDLKMRLLQVNGKGGGK